MHAELIAHTGLRGGELGRAVGPYRALIESSGGRQTVSPSLPGSKLFQDDNVAGVVSFVVLKLIRAN